MLLSLLLLMLLVSSLLLPSIADTDGGAIARPSKVTSCSMCLPTGAMHAALERSGGSLNESMPDATLQCEKKRAVKQEKLRFTF